MKPKPPTEPSAWDYNVLGRNQLNKDNFKAIEYLTKAIIIAPNFQSAYFNRAIAYNNVGEYDNAIIDANKAIQLSPTSGNSYDVLGDAYFGQKKYEDAIINYTRAIELPREVYAHPFVNAGNAGSYHSRAIAHNKIGKFKEALDDVNQAIALNPQKEEYKNSKEVIESNFSRSNR